MEQKEESPESSYKFKALVITGPAGSGKTFTSQKIGVPSNLMRNVLNTDEQVEKLFPEYGLTLKFAHRAADEADTISSRKAMISRKCQRNRNPRPKVDAVALRLGIRQRTSVDCDKDVWGWRRWRHRRRLRWLAERDSEGDVEKRQHRSLARRLVGAGVPFLVRRNSRPKRAGA